MQEKHQVKTFAVWAPRTRAGSEMARLAAAGLLEPALEPVAAGGALLIPVREPVPGSHEVVSRIRAGSAPRDRALLWLRERVSLEVLANVPAGWDRVGDALLIKGLERLGDHAATVAEGLAWATGARSVLEDRGAHGSAREPHVRLVWGDPVTRTVQREHGVAYVLDPARVMWSSGNVNERSRLVRAAQAGEHVVDLTAGIGYFALPLALAGCRVTAVERNPVAAQFLHEAARLNGVADRIEVLVGDARTVGPAGVGDRVLVGCFPGASALLPAAARALRPGGRCFVHVHDLAPAHAPLQVWHRVAARLSALEPRLLAWRVVKSYGPGTVHAVVDVEVRA